MTDRPAVIDDPAHHRFTVTVDGHVAELTYERTDDRLVLIHTGVPKAIDGHGLGTLLVLAAIDDAAAHQLTVVPRCPFARRYLRRHPEVAARVKIDWPVTDPPSLAPDRIGQDVGRLEQRPVAHIIHASDLAFGSRSCTRSIMWAPDTGSRSPHTNVMGRSEPSSASRHRCLVLATIGDVVQQVVHQRHTTALVHRRPDLADLVRVHRHALAPRDSNARLTNSPR